ncbi:SdrD B-like domain-containing protein [Actinophytocola xanthii]|uniref:SD-repeat containing protein B domain-containing protein n=1 Tax=Actinophytocola xanthii TaxID=1912961 RepID=A0A1Q8CQ64_9PSEU|nr:SdrD B-like domain-containing protein [Actinophytocola xanthii]OLF16498.1 hypothetical protein BU204_16800 [Actinophytocola xanthii]
MAGSLSRPLLASVLAASICVSGLSVAHAVERAGAASAATSAPRQAAGETISGTVYNDRNANGVLDPGDSPVVGVPVAVSGDAVATTNTDSAGRYSFTSLGPGTFTVTETQPSGFAEGEFVAGPGATALTPSSFTVVLAPNAVSAGNDFTERGTSALSGQVFADDNGNGVTDPGETGIPAVTLTLTGPTTLTTTTDTNGDYTFDVLPPGTYTLTEIQPTGYLDGQDRVGTRGGALAPPDSVSGIVLTGTAGTGYLFGDVLPNGIAGTVRTPDGDPIPGVEVTLTGTDDLGAVNRTTTTDASGGFAFADVRPGSYTLTQASGTAFTDVGAIAGDEGSVVNPNVIGDIVLAAGESSTGHVFVDIAATLSGTVFFDRDKNGEPNADSTAEPGIGGVTVTLTGTDLDGNPVTRTAVTTSDGEFELAGLPGGTFTLTETQPEAYQDGEDSAGTLGGTPVDPDSVTGIVVPVGGTGSGYLFAELGSLIEGYVYLDTDANGQLDEGEGGIEGVTVTLTDAEDNVLFVRITNYYGYYEFPTMPAGEYRVYETQPAGYGSTTPNVLPVDVGVGDHDCIDFGEELGSVGDFVWSDLDENGVQDAGEPGVPGVTLTLVDLSGVEDDRTTKTDAEGRYRFGNLRVGTYDLVITLPEPASLSRVHAGPEPVDSDFDEDGTVDMPITIEVTGDDITHLDEIDAGLLGLLRDLSAAITADPARVGVDDRFTVTGRTTNKGTQPVVGAMVLLVLDGGLVVGEVTAEGWTCRVFADDVDDVDSGDQAVFCETEQALDPGDRATPIAVTASGTRPSTASTIEMRVTLADGEPDDNPDNDLASARVAVVESSSDEGGPGGPGTTPQGSLAPGLASTGVPALGTFSVAVALLALGALALLAGRRRGRDRTVRVEPPTGTGTEWTDRPGTSD